MLVRHHVHRLASSAFGCHSLLRPKTPKSPIPLVSSHTRDFNSDSTASHDVGILGGGITGLACAYYLTRELPSAKVTLYEAKDRIGGWLESKRVPVKDGSILFESGPRTLRPQANGILTASLMQELDLAKDAIFTQNTAPAARNRFLYYPDHLVRMPHPSYGIAENIWNLWSEPVFGDGIVWAGLTEFWKNARDPSLQDESIGDFFSRRFGKPMVDRILSAVIHGVYAGDVYQLSAKSLFPGLWRDEGLHGSVLLGRLKAREQFEMTKSEAEFVKDMKDFSWDPLLKATLRESSVFTFKDGLGMLTDRLYSKLFETGRVEFKTSASVTAIAPVETGTGVEVSTTGAEGPRTHSHVISALSPWHLNTAARTSSSSQLVPEIPTVTVMTVNLYFRTPDLHEPGFGYLIPQATPFENNPERALGVVFDTAYAPSPSDLNPENWHTMDVDQLKQAREQGKLVNVNDFAWYNMPEKPHLQDHVQQRGTKVTVMLGGHWWNGWPSYPDEKEGLALARSLLERHLGIREEPEAWQVNLEKDCIPQYTVGHEKRLKQAHNNIWREFKGRLRVAGNWMSGVGVNDAVRSARDVAKHFSRGSTGLEHIGEVPTVKMKPVRRGQKDSEKE